jgi:hypothetical protein
VVADVVDVEPAYSAKPVFHKPAVKRADIGLDASTLAKTAVKRKAVPDATTRNPSPKANRLSKGAKANKNLLSFGDEEA